MRRSGRYGALLALSMSAWALGCSDSSDGPRASAGGASGSGSGAQSGGSGGTATGGSGNGATGGSATGGNGAAGSGGDGPAPSSGCGASSWPEPGTFSIDVGGLERQYILALPESYDPATPYRLVFAWHGRTGTAEQVARGFGGGFYGLSSAARGGDSTIFVAGQGLGTDEDPADTGWPNSDGRDIDFVAAMLDSLRRSYCIDESRIFSVGMSYGGIMSHTIGCELGDVFRGIAPIAGAIFGGGPNQAACTGPVAAWMTHGSADMTLTLENGVRGLERWLTQNGCDQTTEAVEPAPCVAYQGCQDGYPVHWCVHDGGHTIPDFSADGIWQFFSQF